MKLDICYDFILSNIVFISAKNIKTII